MVVVALGTGMRASEVLGLDREQLDCRNAVTKLKDTKNGDRRIFPLSPYVVDVLQQRPTPMRDFFLGWTLDKLRRLL